MIEAMDRSQPARPWWLLPPGRIHSAWWVAISAAVVCVDYFTGPNIQFPMAYVFPVIFAAWYSGKAPALMLAIVMPLVHLAFVAQLLRQHESLAGLVAMTTFRGIVIIFMALWFARLSEHERELNRRVEVLEGLLPICTFCKSIRNEAGNWERLETYISRRSEAVFSHGLCPSCGKTHYPDMLEDASARTST
jgi:hypothetical protein